LLLVCVVVILDQHTSPILSLLFFFIDPPTTEIYTLSLHDALPISARISAPSVGVQQLWTIAATGGVPERLAIPDALRGRDCQARSEEHTSELQSLRHLVCRLLLEKKKNYCVCMVC